MFKGRKVSNPVVHGATGGATGRQGGDKDLARAWNSVGKAKTDLRKIEHRLGDVEARMIPRLNETEEMSITDYSMDNNQTYNLPSEFPSGAVVDQYGRSAYMRNKAHGGRKVSRLDEKYAEDEEGGRAGRDRNSGKEFGVNGNWNKERRGNDRAAAASPKRVDFHDRLDMREINLDGTYTDLAVGGVNSLLAGQEHRPNSPSSMNTTDSTAVRNTDIRFLNDTRHLPQKNDSNVRWKYNANHVVPSGGSSVLTHVNVKVPSKQGTAPTTKTTHFSSSNQNVPPHDGDKITAEMDRRWEVGSSDSCHSDDRPVNRRFKASIKDMNKDGLAKLKEKIRKQQEKSSPSPTDSHELMDVMGAAEATANVDNAPRRVLHSDFEPVEPRSYDLPPPDGAASKQPKVRKVAAGPPLPTYKGFSETEVRFKHGEPKPTKIHDIRKKERRKKAFKLQEKKHDPPDDLKDDQAKAAEKPRKMVRLVAASKPKPAKQEKKDIITTSSWRAGQELVLRELGPVKHRRSSQTSQTSDTAGERGNIPDGATDDGDTAAVNEHTTATAAELEKARALSEEARRVLSDLNFTGSDEEDWRRHRDEPRHREFKTGSKRKAPKSAEGEKQLPSAKHRHYDSEEIRRYMQKQKHIRLKQQKEDERRQREADEVKRKQLEELYNKQKQTVSTTTTQGRKGKPDQPKSSKAKHRGEEGHPASYSELPRHHPFHELDRQRMLVSSESEKENYDCGVVGSSRRGESEDVSDGSSTITGDSMEETTPTITPRVDAEQKAKHKMKSQRSDSQNVAGDSNIRSAGGFTFNVDSVLSKFSQALHHKGGDLNVPPTTNSGYTSVSSNGGLPVEVSGELPRTREDRIQAIKATAASLQNRIQAEARKITGQDLQAGATSNPNSSNTQWALTRSAQSEDTFMSRYQKMIGSDNDFSVFTSNLPGRRDLPPDHPEDSENTMEAAAIRIQAAYRGHTVRQSLNWKLPSGETVRASHRNREEDESSITETSTFSDITITEDSENDSVSSPSRVIGAGLRERDFHAGGSRQNRPSDELHIPRPARSSGQSKDSKYSWDDSPTDPYNVLNVYARQHRNQAKQRPGENSRPKNSSTPVKEDPVRAELRPTQQTVPKSAPKPAPRPDTQSRVPGVGRHSPVNFRTSAGFSSIITDTLHNERSRSEANQPKVSFKTDDSEDDTLEEEPRVKESEEKPKPYTRERRPVKPYPAASKPVIPVKSDSDASLESSQDQSLSFNDVSHGDSGPSSLSKGPPRYSPNTLERHFYAELNQLESMEESMRQLTSMEKTRAVSMAQQETVSLAQMLKARQQAHEREMKVLEMKAQKEALDATQQLEGARKRAANVTQSESRLRTDNETVLKSILTDPEASRAGHSLLDSDNIRPRKTVKVSYSDQDSKRHPDSSYTSERKSHLSYSSSNSLSTSYKTSRTEIKTATGVDSNRDSDSSIRTASGAEGVDESKSDSIQEDISQASGDEYSVIFDETMTEDEMEERSFKAILPSESHRKRAKKQMSDTMSVTSDDGSVSAPATPRMTLDDLSSFFTGEESFNKFTEEMVKQFMKEEEMRSQHQNSLLRLREKALMEKTKAELAWLEQQKHRMRNKGADDNYPQIIKKQRGLKMRLQEQQAEIKRLQEANKAASRERKIILQQREEISRIRHSTQQTKEKMKGRGRLGRPQEVHTEDEVSALDERLEEANRREQKKDYKSDSEIYTEPKTSGKKSSADASSLLKKIHLDAKFLTAREHKLLDRRKNAEELLRWKKRLDEEEAKIYKLEQKAMKVWDKTDGKKKTDKDQTSVKQVVEEKIVPKSRKDAKESQTASTIQESSAISEHVITAKDDSSLRRSVTETPRTEIASGSESSPEEPRQRRDKKGLGAAPSESESSIPEEVASVSSVEEPSITARKTKASGADDTLIESQYANESFEETTTSKKSAHKSPRLFGHRSPSSLQGLVGRNIRSPKSPFNKGRSSESESEESISHTDASYTETQSDISDHEGRVRALSDELRRRKNEADRLAKERKKRKREMLKSKEEALRKQIEAYDNTIHQLKAELQKEMEHEPVKAGSVKPQIKQPKVSPTKNKVKADTTPPRSNASSICEEPKDDSSAQSSPSIIEEKEQKQVTPAVKAQRSISQSLEKISEDSETLSKSRSEVRRSPLRQPGSRESSYHDRTEGTDEIGEEISQAESVSQSELLHISKESPRIVTGAANVQVSQVEDDDDESYSMDFTDPQTASAAAKHLASSHNMSEMLDAKEQEKSIRTATDQISEQISEAMSVRSDSESFMPRLNLQKTNEANLQQEEESDVDPKSPRSSYSTTRTDSSRPSSEKSERSSVSSHGTNVDDLSQEEESELTPSLPASLPPTTLDHGASDEEVEISDLQPKPAKSHELRDSVGDIDDLLGLKDDESDEEVTPIPSPPGEEVKEADLLGQLDPLGDFSIGDRVLVNGPQGSKKPGTLLFKGKVSFAPGIWAGIELDASDGNNDGSHDGHRYFTCRSGHGVLVPGDTLMPQPAERSPRRSISRDSYASSTTSVDSHDDESVTEEQEEELSKLISMADNEISGNAPENEVTPRDENRRRAQADHITEEILAGVIREDMNAMHKALDKKTPPPVAPKPSRRNETNDNILVNGVQEPDINQNDKGTYMTEKLTKNLLDDAIADMITIRNKQRNRHAHIADFDPFQVGTDESYDDKVEEEEEGKQAEIPPRPVSPVPQPNRETEDLYIDDSVLPSTDKPPPPYPGTQQENMPDSLQLVYRESEEELAFAVPHDRNEIESLVSQAVDVFWNQRRYGESLEGVEPPESYYTHEDNNNDMEGKSRRVYKKLLFDLTGDIIREIYKDEDIDELPPWQKARRRQQKYFRGVSAPTTVDVLKPIVHKAVIDMLGLNGSQKSDKTRWSVRKKKDHVDNILVRELRDEEPDWVNYNEDEMAVKMQLTEAIFESLLVDTMQTMNKIFRKKQHYVQK